MTVSFSWLLFFLAVCYSVDTKPHGSCLEILLQVGFLQVIEVPIFNLFIGGKYEAHILEL